MKYNTNIKGLSDDEIKVLEAINKRDSGFNINPFSAIAKSQMGVVKPLNSGVKPVITWDKLKNWINTDNTGISQDMENEFRNVKTQQQKPKRATYNSVRPQISNSSYVVPTPTRLMQETTTATTPVLSDEQVANIGNLLTGGIEENSTAGPSNGIMEYYRGREQDMNPYLEQIQKFIDNYGKYQKIYDDLDTYYRGLAGWTGNQAWANYAQSHNPVEIEKAKLGLYGELAKQQISNRDKLYEIIANDQMARALGLPEGATLANKELTKQFGQMNRLEKTLDWKRESKKIDEFIKQKELEYKYWMTNQNNARARDVANIISNARRYQADMNYKIYGNNDNSNSSVSGLYGDGKSNI